MANMLYRKDTGEILGVHIIGLHAADLIHEASNAIATKQTVQVGRCEQEGGWSICRMRRKYILKKRPEC